MSRRESYPQVGGKSYAQVSGWESYPQVMQVRAGSKSYPQVIPRLRRWESYPQVTRGQVSGESYPQGSGRGRWAGEQVGK